MKKFEFSLEGILSIKRKLESQEKMNFAVAQAALNAEEAKRDEIIRRREGYRDELTGLMNDKLDIIEINRCQDAIDIMSEKLSEQEIAVKRAERQVELARVRLNTVMMERKSMEKLREKQFDQYLSEYNAEERKQIDELVSYRHSAEDEEEYDDDLTGEKHG